MRVVGFFVATFASCLGELVSVVSTFSRRHGALSLAFLLGFFLPSF